VPVVDALLPDEIVAPIRREDLAHPVGDDAHQDVLGLLGDTVTAPASDVGP
jgi:hypothetical protein